MKTTEFIAERVGFGAMGLFAGAAYGLAISIIIVFALKKMSLMFVLKVFCTIFAAAGVIFGKRIETVVNGSLYAVYFIWGAVLAATAESGVPVSRGAVPQKGAALYIVVLGAISILACFLLWQFK